MTVVRLRCPQCSAVVKIGEDVAARYPMVRCAQCQGLVNVASDRMPTATTSATPRKKTPRRRSSVNRIPVGMIVGILTGLVLLASLGVGIYLLIDQMGGSGPERNMKKGIALMEKMVETLEGVKEPGDVAPAIDKLRALQKEAKEYSDKNKTLLSELDEATKARLLEDYLPQIMKLQNRLSMAFGKMMSNPSLAKMLPRESGLLQTFFGMAGDLKLADQPHATANVIPQPGMDNEMKRSPTSTNNSAPDADEIARKDLEFLLITRTNRAKMIPDLLNNIHNSESAEPVLKVLSSLIDELQDNHLKITKIEEEKVLRPDNATTRKAQNELRKITSDIEAQLQRLSKLEGMQRTVQQIKRMLGHAKLMVYYETPVAGNQESSTDNPFKEAKPAKSDPENPFKPASPPEQNTSPEIDNLLDQLKGKDFFKKMDVVKEIASIRVVETQKKAVLDALLNVLEDNEIHQKHEVFKACRKWATTEEDRELIGQHAETLLKDHWCKKDALRYFADNQVVSASKEVARLLKDHFERKEAAECLITMGNAAQKAVMPHLTDLEPQVRYITIEILARIGDKDAIPELQKVQNDRLVGTAAKQAIKVILSRNK